ncbi:acyltransferase [Acidisphaera sp. L21]|uniref:acyltransferase family protein n=1 Tax=Acidisphaera sp. L21 TaxID=1641851 RepID=UPI00131E700C|nr:acyltransferase [Acidisphaera sp. L21]
MSTWMLRLARLPSLIGRPPGAIQYNAQIDGLRGLSILLVIVWHVSLRAARHASELSAQGPAITNLYSYIPHGEIGVDFFFFISAIVITQIFATRTDKRLEVGKFYARRLWRIYPPYLVALTGCFIALYASGHAPGSISALDPDAASLPESYAASLFYLHGLVFSTAPLLDPPLWSLEIEIQFYLVGPLIWVFFKYMPDRTKRVAALSALLAAMIVIPPLLKLYMPFDGRFRFGLLAHAYLFVGGMLAVSLDLATPSTDPRLRPALYDAMLAVGLVAAAGVGLVLTQIDAQPSGFWATLLLNVVTIAAIFGVFLGAMRGAIGRFVFGIPWLCLIGTMCYSIYLTHVVAIQIVSEKLLGRLAFRNPELIWGVWFLVLIPVSIAGGIVFYVYVERPFMSRRKTRHLQQVS